MTSPKDWVAARRLCRIGCNPFNRLLSHPSYPALPLMTERQKLIAAQLDKLITIDFCIWLQREYDEILKWLSSQPST